MYITRNSSSLQQSLDKLSPPPSRTRNNRESTILLNIQSLDEICWGTITTLHTEATPRSYSAVRASCFLEFAATTTPLWFCTDPKNDSITINPFRRSNLLPSPIAPSHKETRNYDPRRSSILKTTWWLFGIDNSYTVDTRTRSPRKLSEESIIQDGSNRSLMILNRMLSEPVSIRKRLPKILILRHFSERAEEIQLGNNPDWSRGYKYYG